MTFKTYQEEAKKTAIFPDLIIRPEEDEYQDARDYNYPSSSNTHSLSWIYPSMGLAGETGEVLEKLKKVIRDDEGCISEEKRKQVEKELGDVLWYLASLATELGLALETIASTNLKKLAKRQEEAKISGSGDER